MAEYTLNQTAKKNSLREKIEREKEKRVKGKN